MELSDDRYEHRRTSAYTHLPKNAGQPKIFAGISPIKMPGVKEPWTELREGRCSSKVQQLHRTTPTVYDRQRPLTCANDPYRLLCP